MKSKLTISISAVLFAVICMATHCEKEPEDRLPPNHETGSGNFGCLIDGEPILQYIRISRTSNNGWPGGDYNITEELFTLVVKTQPPEYHINFFVTRPKFGTGTFVIDSVIFYPADTSIPYYYMAKNTAQITFTKFSEEFSPATASGTFEFDADGYDKETHQHNPNQKIQVRKGRFDVCYYPRY